MKAHFSPMSWRFLLLMSCVHGLPSATKSSFALFVLFFFSAFCGLNSRDASLYVTVSGNADPFISLCKTVFVCVYTDFGHLLRKY